jgi:hypothetical protein
MSCDMPPARRWLLLFTALAHLSTAAAFSTSFLNLTPKVHGGSLAAPSTCSKLVPRLRSRDAAARGEVRMGAELLAGVMGKSVLFGGALAGGLHAAKPRPESPRSPALAPACEARRVLTGHSPGGAQVSGPDHFPALLPRCMGKPWFPAAKIGSLWGSLPTPAPLSRTPWLAPPALGAWGAGGTCRGPSGRSTRRCPWKVPLEESFRRSTLLFSRYFWLRRVVPLPLSCRFGHGLSAMAMGLAFFLVKDKALHTNKSPPARRARPRPVACACLS